MDLITLLLRFDIFFFLSVDLGGNLERYFEKAYIDLLVYGTGTSTSLCSKGTYYIFHSVYYIYLITLVTGYLAEQSD